MYTGSKVSRERVNSAAPSIFRAHALRQYAERAAEPVFPRSAAPTAFVSRWALFGALVCLACLALSSRVPIYVRGIAIIAASYTDEQGRPAMAIFIPSQESGRLRIGQRVLVRLTPSGPAETGRIATIRPGIMTEQQIRDLVDITASAALTLAGSKAVALAETDPASTIGPAGNVPGCHEALVEVGSRGAITLLSWGQSTQ